MLGKRCLMLCALVAVLAGCSSMSTPDPAVPEVMTARQPDFLEYTPPPAGEGSLWSPATEISLFPDRRARKIGDIVTVRIVEDPEAKLNGQTDTSRSSSALAKLKFLGYMQALADSNPRLAQNPGEDDLINATLAMNFKGKGSTARDGHVKAYIAAVVERVLPNGNLYIRGEREIRVNNETQLLTFSGLIRPEDVGQYNEIASTYVAAVQMEYSGSGPVGDKQRPGWMMRITDYVWPF